MTPLQCIVTGTATKIQRRFRRGGLRRSLDAGWVKLERTLTVAFPRGSTRRACL
jgi:hypothetical protein